MIREKNIFFSLTREIISCISPIMTMKTLFLIAGLAALLMQGCKAELSWPNNMNLSIGDGTMAEKETQTRE